MKMLKGLNMLFKLVLWIAFLVFLVIVGPFLTIWSLNTLFPALDIPYALETWAAVIILQLALKGEISYKK
jgi:hypothetical protein